MGFQVQHRHASSSRAIGWDEFLGRSPVPRPTPTPYFDTDFASDCSPGPDSDYDSEPDPRPDSDLTLIPILVPIGRVPGSSAPSPRGGSEG
eukprot:gene10291-biopygen7428